MDAVPGDELHGKWRRQAVGEGLGMLHEHVPGNGGLVTSLVAMAGETRAPSVVVRRKTATKTTTARPKVRKSTMVSIDPLILCSFSCFASSSLF